MSAFGPWLLAPGSRLSPLVSPRPGPASSSEWCLCSSQPLSSQGALETVPGARRRVRCSLCRGQAPCVCSLSTGAPTLRMFSSRGRRVKLVHPGAWLLLPELPGPGAAQHEASGDKEGCGGLITNLPPESGARWGSGGQDAALTCQVSSLCPSPTPSAPLGMF